MKVTEIFRVLDPQSYQRKWCPYAYSSDSRNRQWVEPGTYFEVKKSCLTLNGYYSYGIFTYAVGVWSDG